MLVVDTPGLGTLVKSLTTFFTPKVLLRLETAGDFTETSVVAGRVTDIPEIISFGLSLTMICPGAYALSVVPSAVKGRQKAVCASIRPAENANIRSSAVLNDLI